MTVVDARAGVGASVFEVAEAQLRDDFTQLLGGVGLAKILHEMPYRNPRNTPLEGYGLVPVMGTPSLNGQPTRTELPAGFQCEVPHGVIVEYHNGVQVHPRPHLDTQRGAGLTYRLDDREYLVALAAAGITTEYWDASKVRLHIKELQGLVSNVMQPELAPALRPGWFKWRESLVNFWLDLAPKINIGTVAMWSIHNNPYAQQAKDKPTRDRFKRGYDDVADNLGFKYDDRSKLWLKDVA